MDSKIPINPSIEGRQKNIKPEGKHGKNIRKEAIYTLSWKAISRYSESNLGRLRMEKGTFL